MTNIEKLNILKDRFNKMENNPKNTQSPGVKRKVARQIHNLELVCKEN